MSPFFSYENLPFLEKEDKSENFDVSINNAYYEQLLIEWSFNNGKNLNFIVKSKNNSVFSDLSSERFSIGSFSKKRYPNNFKYIKEIENSYLEDEFTSPGLIKGNLVKLTEIKVIDEKDVRIYILLIIYFFYYF